MLGKITSAPIRILLLLLGIFAVVVVYNEFQKTCCAQKPEDKKSSTFSANINGYYMTCVSNKTISKRTNSSWEEVKEALPKRQGGYYLDDTFVNFVPDNDLGCDYFSCNELPKPYKVELIEHKKIGDKPPPPNSRKVVETVAVYKTVPLSGEIKIDVDYYADKNCSNKKTFSTITEK